MTAVLAPTYDPTNSGNFPGDGPLRIGGNSTSGVPSTDANLPSTYSECAKSQQSQLKLVRDLAAGPERIAAMGAAYLPQNPGEEQQNYTSRLQRSVFFNFYRKTVEALVGFIFRKDPKIGDDVPPLIVQHLENIDNAGTHFDVFVREIIQDAEIAGHAAIFVEYPKTDGTQTLADERSSIRPYWIPIKKDNIVSWRTSVEYGKTILTQLVLKERTRVPDGAFGEKEQIQYRVLYRDGGVVGFRLLGITDNKVVYVVEDGLYPTQDEIPIAEIGTSGRKGIFESDPPLIDLAHLNIAHYQQYSDYATSMHMTCVPILFTAAVTMVDAQGNKITVGPNSGINSTNPSAKAEYVSHNGAALTSCKQSLDDLKSDIGTLGVAALAPQKRVAETAKAKELDKVAGDSALAVTARSAQDGIERALGFHAKYLRIATGGGSIELNRDYTDMSMSPELLTAMTGAVQLAGLPPRILTNAMQEGGLISDDEDADAVGEEMVANAAAADAQRQIEQQAKVDATQGVVA